MHFLKSILYLISSISLTVGFGAGNFAWSRVDSLYSEMSDFQKVSQLIWVAPDDHQDLQKTEFGGYYFDQPLRHEPGGYDKTIAVQLDERLNPFTADSQNLPDMFTLSSLSNEELLSTYFHFLKSYAKGHNIDYLILPSEGRHDRINLLIRKMHAHDPSFFIEKKSLSFEETKRRKQVAELLDKNTFWVIPENYRSTVSKKLPKYADRLIDEVALDQRIKQNLLNALHDLPHQQIALPQKLAVEIGRESVISLSKKPILPLQVDTVCFLTNEPYGEMANMLRKYSFVITEYEDIARSGAAVIVDNDAFFPSEIDLTDRKVIFAGERTNLVPIVDQVDAALIYSIDSDIYSYLLPQQLFGSHGASGVLPIIEPHLSSFQNVPLAGLKKLGYAPAEMTGLDRKARERIEEIVQEAINSGSTPGVQLAIAVDGSIVLEEAYGYLTYDSLIPVQRSTLYDLASVTKVTATLLATMKLYEDGLLDLDATIDQYLPNYTKSNKNFITVRALLSHNAGLKPYVPFWQKALNGDFVETFVYETEEDLKNDKRSYGLKPDQMLLDSLKSWIVHSPLLQFDSIPSYAYSDIGFMILHEVVETITQEPMDSYLQRSFYGPMGLKRLTFNPLQQGFEMFEIAPTEHDYYFRDELVWGEVHDRNAAVFGGVAGHAGLFANAHELLVLLQTIMQDGSYSGTQYLKAETVAYFNQKFYQNNRRALGWDKPDIRVGNASILSSEHSFGHTGFTGTMVWADPAYDLLFVFLSNRIHPNSNNYQLIRRNIRTRIQDVVYEALLAKWMN